MMPRIAEAFAVGDVETEDYEVWVGEAGGKIGGTAVGEDLEFVGAVEEGDVKP